jgi:hypothetical protein
LTTYNIVDHGTWQSVPVSGGAPSLQQVGTGIEWNAYRQNAANFHGGVLVTMMSDPANPGSYTSGAASTDISMISPYGRLIELLNYTGLPPNGYSPELSSASVVINGNTATFTKPYTLSFRDVLSRMTDAEMYAVYARDQDQPLRARLSGTAVLLTSVLLTSGTPLFNTVKAAYTSLFGAARAEVLLAAP